VTARVVLVGAPGVGKSTIGQALAAAIDVAFVDVDDLIADAAGETCASLLRSRGEAVFREAEASALASALSSQTMGVVATGAGAVESASSRALLAGAPLVVQLAAAPEVLVARLAGGDRPLLEPLTVERLTRLLERRAELYAQVASVVVDAAPPVDDVVTSILAIMVHA